MEEEETREAPRASFRSDQRRRRGGRGDWLPACLLCCLAVLILLAATDRFLGSPLVPPTLPARLRNAAQAVLTAAGDAGDQNAAGAEGGTLSVPLHGRYDRQQAVELALELDSLGRSARDALVRFTAPAYAGAARKLPRAEVTRLSELTHRADSKLSEFLGVSVEEARPLLYAMGWPWVFHDPLRLEPRELRPPAGPGPEPIQDAREPGLEDMVARAGRSPGWPAARTALRNRYDLSENEVEALRAHMCRRKLEKAFDGPLAARSARRTLTTYTNLTGTQFETLLAMQGALQLTRSGTQAFPTLLWLLERRPGLASPLLRRCAEATSVRRQARLAALRLSGQEWKEARRELLALGPFGAHAVAQAMDQLDPVGRERARGVLEQIRKRWPGEGRSLEVLGSDTAAWRRWYEDARTVL